MADCSGFTNNDCDKRHPNCEDKVISIWDAALDDMSHDEERQRLWAMREISNDIHNSRIVQPTATGNGNLCMYVVDNSHLDVDERATANNNTHMTVNDIVNSVDNNKVVHKKKARKGKKQNQHQKQAKQRERNNNLNKSS